MKLSQYAKNHSKNPNFKMRTKNFMMSLQQKEHLKSLTKSKSPHPLTLQTNEPLSGKRTNFKIMKNCMKYPEKKTRNSHENKHL